jgi:hypothetical protein
LYAGPTIFFSAPWQAMQLLFLAKSALAQAPVDAKTTKTMGISFFIFRSYENQ